MAEYIEREALRAFPIRADHCDKEHANKHFICGIEAVLEYVESLPAADVAPVRHGKWIKGESVYYPDDYYRAYHNWYCSNCRSRCARRVNGETVNDRHKLPKYCPECGAQMDGEE